MTDRHPNGAIPINADADRLSAAWNDLVTGISPDHEAIEPELLRLAGRLSDRPVGIHARPDFRDHLKETIMQSPIVALPIGPSQHVPLTGRSLPVQPRPSPGQIATLVARTGMRWTAIAATIALLLMTAAGGYLNGVRLPRDGQPATRIAALDAATPVPATPTRLLGCGAYDDVDPYFPCFGTAGVISRFGVASDLLSEVGDVSQVQMQHWQINGGNAVTFKAPTAPLSGVGVDVIINGAYTGRFSEPVDVWDYQPKISINRVLANSFVELTSGDVVVYKLGTKLDVRNPLAISLLQYKTVQFYRGSPHPENVVASGGLYSVAVDGNGTLNATLAEHGAGGVNFTITYLTIVEGVRPSGPSYMDDIVLGSVDVFHSPTGTTGYVLWAFPIDG